MFGHLKSYTVHVRPEGAHPYQDPVLVREGFSLFAAVVPLLWALLNRLWMLALGLAVLSLVLEQLEEAAVLTDIGSLIIAVTVSVLLGYLACDLKRALLRRKGYVTADIVVATNEMAARQRFYERHAHAL